MVWIDLKRVPVALTIAGSDSGGGAGIQADLKTFAALGVHGTVALTSITAQNTKEVTAIQDVSVDVIKAQIEAVVSDIGVDAAKTGMLHTSEIIEAVAEEVRRHRFPLVVDPVMIAKSGAPLLRKEAVRSLVEELLPLAKVVTPNAREAEVISGIEVRSLEDARRAARLIAELGPQAVIVKGGHIESDESVDLLYDGEFTELRAPRIESRNTHGTGCSFSAAIAAELAKGRSIRDAFRTAKLLVTEAIRYGIPVGGGHGPLNPMAQLYKESERYSTVVRVAEAVRVLESIEDARRIAPEVGMNVAMSLPYADGPEDVAAVPGRIRLVGRRLRASAHPEFGASRHLAGYILTARGYDPSVRAALNIAYSDETLDRLREMGLRISWYDRREEPPEVKAREGATVPWGMRVAVERIGRLPDVVFHTGDWGKEPMIVLIGRDAVSLAEIVREVSS
ncbi:MAG: bifunctional hydroxymethylpyrimidine kinase/phosphomethylpyrimidine kinase [Candidatus Korarchaeota archaeon NZ13-K]|nr:MAG: bifunctional hydroxymethylpyrimidine kinase/phosphomethylpyrimidine kinase [Candidatus Korarchaeota archaeon NZ13-K]